MKQQLNPWVAYGLIALVVVAVIIAIAKSGGRTTVPATEIKSPPPPGGAFPSGPRAGLGMDGKPVNPAPEGAMPQ